MMVCSDWLFCSERSADWLGMLIFQHQFENWFLWPFSFEQIFESKIDHFLPEIFTQTVFKTVISDDELRRIIELCLEQQEHLVGLESNHENLDICLTQAEGMIRNVELRLETEETLEKIDLIEERISTLNNVKNGLEQDYLNQLELRNNRNVTEFNEAEKVRQIQTKIEAQLYLNLQ